VLWPYVLLGSIWILSVADSTQELPLETKVYRRGACPSNRTRLTEFARSWQSRARDVFGRAQAGEVLHGFYKSKAIAPLHIVILGSK
jgi:hypothetical protein